LRSGLAASASAWSEYKPYRPSIQSSSFDGGGGGKVTVLSTANLMHIFFRSLRDFEAAVSPDGLCCPCEGCDCSCAGAAEAASRLPEVAAGLDVARSHGNLIEEAVFRKIIGQRDRRSGF